MSWQGSLLDGHIGMVHIQEPCSTGVKSCQYPARPSGYNPESSLNFLSGSGSGWVLKLQLRIIGQIMGLGSIDLDKSVYICNLTTIVQYQTIQEIQRFTGIREKEQPYRWVTQKQSVHINFEVGPWIWIKSRSKKLRVVKNLALSPRALISIN